MITNTIYNLLQDSGLFDDCNIYINHADDSVTPEKLITITELPSGGISNYYTRLSLLQVDVYAVNHQDCGDKKDDLIRYFVGKAQIVDGNPLTFRVETDLGIYPEDGTNYFRGTLTISVFNVFS